MARDLELRIQGDSKGADAALAAAAREMDKAAREADKLGRAFDAAKRDAEQLDRELARNAAAVKLLAKEYSTADASIRGDIKKRLDAERSAGNELKRIRSELIGDTEKDSAAATATFAAATKQWSRLAAKAKRDTRAELDKAMKDAAKQSAEDSATIFENGFIEGLKKPQIIAAGAAIGALLAIPIGALVGGAILAGAGVGAAGLAGFAAAKADQQGRVAASFNDLLATFNKQFTAGGKTAIDPLLDGIRELKLGLQDVHLDRIIESASKFIQPLAAGAARFATYLSQGVEDLVNAGGPAVKVFAEELPALGKAIKEAFDAIASGGDDGARALQDFLHWLEAAIIATGQVIGFLEKAYGAVRAFGDGFENALTSIQNFARNLVDAGGQVGAFGVAIGALFAPVTYLTRFFDTGKEKATGYGHSLSGASQDAAILADQAKQTAEEIQQIGSAFQNLGQSTEGALTNQILDRMFALDDATVNFQKALAGLDDTVKQNGTSLDVLNEKTGRYNDKALANEQALLAAAKANADLYAQNLLSGDSAEEAAAKYEKNSATLRAQAIAAGYNAKEVDGLIGKYGQVPEKVQTILATIGLTEALNHLGQILVDFRSLDDKTFQTKYFVDTYYRDHGGAVGGNEAAHHQLPPGHRAAGGPVMKGRPYIVGEKRPEVFVPDVPGRILSSVPAGFGRAGTSVSSLWGAARTQPASMTISFDGSTDSAFATAFMRLVRNGVIQISAN